jgi:hypothetical protein
VQVRETVEAAPNGKYMCCGVCCTGDIPIDESNAHHNYFSHYDVLAGTTAREEVCPRPALASLLTAPSVLKKSAQEKGCCSRIRIK